MNTHLKNLIETALSEDIGSGDITTRATIPVDSTSTAEMRAKQDMGLAGLDVAGEVFHHLDPRVQFTPLAKDGDKIKAGTVIARISGKTRVLLTGERVALNFLKHLSGIATLTAKYVEQLKGLKAQVLDTRKTLPGLRQIEKYAVRMGGGRNHRFGLFDGILIKDNHIKAAGGITKAVESARRKARHLPKIEVETGNLDDVREALSAKAHTTMLHNIP